MEQTGEITKILQRISNGDGGAEEEAFEVLYKHLRGIAVRQMNRERDDHTLQPSALVNEAYLKLARQKNKSWHNRAHFLAVASQVMRQILVDHARQKRAQVRGGDAAHEPITGSIANPIPNDVDMLELDQALSRLAALDPRQAQLVECRFFGGMSESEMAEFFGLSERTIRREWASARAFLYGQLKPGTTHAI